MSPRWPPSLDWTADQGRATADREVLHVLRHEAQIHVVVGLDSPGRIVLGVSIDEAVKARNGSRKTIAALLEPAVIIELPVYQWRDVEIALVGQIELELQAAHRVLLLGCEGVVLDFPVGPEAERDVLDEARDRKRFAVRDLIETPRAAVEAIELHRALGPDA